MRASGFCDSCFALSKNRILLQAKGTLKLLKVYNLFKIIILNIFHFWSSQTLKCESPADLNTFSGEKCF